MSGCPTDARDATLDAVVVILKTHGYDAVTIRRVAEHARVSSKTIYKHFATRDDMIVSAIEKWMAEQVYAQFTSPRAGESARDTIIRWVHASFGPWEDAPSMLKAYHRARAGPHGARLGMQGLAAVRPAVEVLRVNDPESDERELQEILGNMAYGLVARFSDGQIAVTEIVPALERAVQRLVPGQSFEAT